MSYYYSETIYTVRVGLQPWETVTLFTCVWYGP